MLPNLGSYETCLSPSFDAARKKIDWNLSETKFEPGHSVNLWAAMKASKTCDAARKFRCSTLPTAPDHDKISDICVRIIWTVLLGIIMLLLPLLKRL
jgi:hypothetical protein